MDPLQQNQAPMSGAPMNNSMPNNAPTGQSNDTVMAVLAYILFLIPLLAGPKTPFVKYHTNQGLVLFLFAIVGHIVLAIIPIIGWVLLPFFPLVIILLAILGIVNASKGQMSPLPIIGGFNLLK